MCNPDLQTNSEITAYEDQFKCPHNTLNNLFSNFHIKHHHQKKKKKAKSRWLFMLFDLFISLYYLPL